QHLAQRPALEPAADVGEDALAHELPDRAADVELLLREERVELQEVQRVRHAPSLPASKSSPPTCRYRSESFVGRVTAPPGRHQPKEAGDAEVPAPDLWGRGGHCERHARTAQAAVRRV